MLENQPLFVEMHKISRIDCNIRKIGCKKSFQNQQFMLEYEPLCILALIFLFSFVLKENGMKKIESSFY